MVSATSKLVKTKVNDEITGSLPAAVEAYGPMRQGVYRQFPALEVETREQYDLVIVGAGISGLAAACLHWESSR